MLSFNLSRTSNFKTFLGARFGFHFRHFFLVFLIYLTYCLCELAMQSQY
jgi:hypothetical protein